MNKKGLFITLAVAIVIAAVLYIITGLNTKTDKNETNTVQLPPYLTMTITKTGEGTTFAQVGSVTIQKVQNSQLVQTASLAGIDFLSTPIETKDGFKIFTKENGEEFDYYAFTSSGELSQLTWDPFSHFSIVDYIVEETSTSVLPKFLRDGTFDSVKLTEIGPGTIKEYIPSTYGDYSEIEYVGTSSDFAYIYFFADNNAMGSNASKSALIKQSLSDKGSFSILFSVDDGVQNSIPSAAEFIASTQSEAYFKYFTNVSSANYDDATLVIKKLNFDAGVVENVGQEFDAYQVFVFSPDRAYMLVRDDPSISMQEANVNVYRTSDGSLLKTLNALTCNQTAISNSGKYIAESCPGIGEDKILNIDTGERTTVATYFRPIDDTGYDVGYSETSFLDFQNPVE